MNPDRAVFIVCLCIAAFWGGVEVQAETDEQKWKRLEQNREARRVIERKFEACVTQCREGCVK